MTTTTGTLRSLHPPLIDCDLNQVALGDALRVGHCRAEVVGVKPGQAQAVLFDDPRGLALGEPVEVLGPMQLQMHPGLRGRVLDALGQPCDGGKPGRVEEDEAVAWPVHRRPSPWVNRPDLPGVLVTGTRVIDGLLTLGQGQRLAWMGSAGCGSLCALAKLARECSADVVVWACIGYHGHQMQTFLEKDLGEQGRQRCLLVAGGADETAAARLQAGYTALAAAEYFRDRGQHVVLILDSLRPWLQAWHELAQQRGQWLPPTRSNLGPLPTWLARCGPGSVGSITALVHLQLEADYWKEDELALALDACLEGRVVLSRRMADRLVYPAFDLLVSISRQFTCLTQREQQRKVVSVRDWLGLYEGHREALESGLIQKGQNPPLDRADERQEAILRFFGQDLFTPSDWHETLEALHQLVRG